MKKLLKTAFMGIWVVPDVQVHILSLGYQEHIFRLFHERVLNRVSHYIGIPIALATLYAALPVRFTLAAAALVTLLHLALAVRHRLWLLCGVAVGVQAVLLAFAGYVLRPFYAAHHGFWSSPWLQIFGWSFLQYATHILELKLPQPWAGKPGSSMAPRDEWLRKATLRHLFFAALAMVPHVFVEWISGPRNLFLFLIRVARCGGYRPLALRQIEGDLERLRDRPEPILRHAHFQEEISR